LRSIANFSPQRTLRMNSPQPAPRSSTVSDDRIN